MTTYVVTYTLLGRTRTMEVWAASTTDAKRKAAATYPAATITSAARRLAF